MPKQLIRRVTAQPLKTTLIATLIATFIATWPADKDRFSVDLDIGNLSFDGFKIADKLWRDRDAKCI
jgi:hypothetical protein